MNQRAFDHERGFTLFMTAACTFVFLGFTALAVDMGMLYIARTQAQNAADAGALAGAFTLVNTPTAPQPGTAQDAAVRIANQSAIMGAQVAITNADVLVDVANHRVKVTVPRTAARGNPVATYFGAIFGIRSVNVAAVATAEAADITGNRFAKPIWMPNTALSQRATQVAACAEPKENLVDQNSPYPATTWGLNQIGRSFTLISQATPCNNNIPPNSYYVIEFGDFGSNTNNNAPYSQPAYDLYTCLWKNGFNSSESACQTAVVNAANCGTGFPGGGYPVTYADSNWTTPSFLGVTGLICGPSGNCGDDRPDIWAGLGQYQPGAGGTASDTSRSLVLVPIWQNCSSNCSGNSNSGGNKIEIVGMAEVFLDSVDPATGNLQMHLVNILGCIPPSSGGGPGKGPYTVPIRLVQTQ